MGKDGLVRFTVGERYKDGSLKYERTGYGDDAFQEACLIRQKHELRKKTDKLLKLGMVEEARALRQSLTEFKTITELSNWYIQLCEDRIEDKAENRKKGEGKISSATYNRYIYYARTVLRHFGSMQPQELELDHLREYWRTRKAEGGAKGTIGAEVGYLRQMFTQARKEKKLRPDQGPMEWPVENELTPRRPITDDEYRALITK